MKNVRSMALAALLALAGNLRAASDFVRPPESFTGQSLLEPLKEQIANKQYADAVLRIDALVREHGDELMATDDGSLISVGTMFDMLNAEAKAALVPEYRKKFDADARDALDAVRRNPTYSVADLYTVARLYPLSKAAGQALALAGDRAAQMADGSAALALYLLAQKAGYPLEDVQARRLTALQLLADGNLSAPDATGPATLPVKPDPRAERTPGAVGRAGPVPFDAPWYDNAATLLEPRFFPLSSDESLLLVGPRAVMRVRDGGPILWSWTAPAASAAAPVPDAPPVVLLPPGGAHLHARELARAQAEPPARGPMYASGLLDDIYGRAEVLVVRQPFESEEHYTVRAFRVSDGKMLWDTNIQLDLRDEQFVGTPTVSGRYTYVTALAPHLVTAPPKGVVVDSALFSLYALDTMSGQPIWQCPMGSYVSPRSVNGRIPEPPRLGDALGHSAVEIAGDAIYFSPGAGILACVGRFDGKIRWMRAFGPPPPKPDPSLKPWQLEQWKKEQANADTTSPAAQRFRDTPALCGSALVVASNNIIPIYGFEPTSGQQLWENADLSLATLIGATPSAALFQSSAVTALDPKTGKPLWTWQPKTGSITGPGVLRTTSSDAVLILPTTAGLVAVNAADGSQLKSVPPVFNFRRFVQNSVGKTCLETLGMAKSFVVSNAP